MKMVNIAEAKAQLSELLEAVAGGQRVVICKRNQPVAEIRAMAAPRSGERSLGLAVGSVTIPPAFFEPLPESILQTFEAPASDPDAVLRAARVAEPRPAPFGASPKPTRAREPRAKR